MDTRRNITKVELLAPAGSAETLQAVIEAGADAVYIGGSRFGARAYADNPGEDSLLRAIDYAHLRGARVYLTVNTLLTDRETADLFEYINPYYMAGLDAVIVQDLGVLSFLRSCFPKLPIHISTQMTITDAMSAELFDEGVTRIVPARELSLGEIRSMRERCGKELEIFAHGALCYCYSGQCLMSSLIGGRSGNRGRCAQPCRKRYTYEEEGVRRYGYLLSPKDQCLLPKLHELLETGIHSLKLEGRMKSLAYAAGVTAIYRKWIDRFYELGGAEYREYLKRNASEMQADVEMLAELFNRGGFCEGYVFGQKGPEMICAKRPNHSGVLVGTANVRREAVRYDRGGRFNDRRAEHGRNDDRFRKNPAQGERLVAVPSFTGKIGPGEVLEFRTADERYVCGEWTTPQDMSGYRIPPVPVVWRKEFGRMPDDLKLNIWRMKKEPLLKELDERYGKNRKPVSVMGSFFAEAGEESILSVWTPDGNASVTVRGEIPQAAEHMPTDEETAKAKLMQTGHSDFAFASLDVHVGEGLFLPVAGLKQLRRDALTKLEEELLKAFRREAGVKEATTGSDGTRNGKVRAANRSEGPEDAAQSCEKSSRRVTVSVMTAEQAAAAVTADSVTDLYIDMEGEYEACLKVPCGLPRYIMLPRALKGEKLRRACEKAERLTKEYNLTGVVVRTMDELAYFRGKDIPMEADKTLYCHNSTSVEYLLGKGVSAVTLSEELRKDEIPEAPAALLTVYGRSVMMVSEQCLRKTTGLCGQGSVRQGVLTDGEGEHFPAKAVCDYCHGLIYNAHIFSLLSCFREVPVTRTGGIRLDFTLESGAETEAVLLDLKTALSGGQPAQGQGYTKGSWNRGTE
ncbi:MAG: U32 family peptidase [Lachnospiraceae bacterium]|nr:U32 family peptidase [Lachnospiraceae bacterium]